MTVSWSSEPGIVMVRTKLTSTVGCITTTSNENTADTDTGTGGP